MCVSIYFQHQCGHISSTANEIQSCDNFELVGDWTRLQAPESQEQIDYCNAMCRAESRTTSRTVDGVCLPCGQRARAAAEAEAARRHNEIFDRIRASVVKPPPHKKI